MMKFTWFSGRSVCLGMRKAMPLLCAGLAVLLFWLPAFSHPSGGLNSPNSRSKGRYLLTFHCTLKGLYFGS